MEGTNSILAAILAVLSQVGAWFIETLQTVVSLFYGESGLTFFGVLAIASLGIALVLLFIRLVTNFIQFRA